MVYEMKLDFKDTKKIHELVKDVYDNGRLNNPVSNRKYLTIYPEDAIFIAIKGLDNLTVKLQNESINGSMRFSIFEKLDDSTNVSEIHLTPANPYMIMEGNKYSFY